MRHLIIGASIAALLAAACGGAAAPSPTASPTASPSPAPAAQVIFTADLKTTNEVPPIANDEKVGSGTATVTFDLTRDSAGKITAGTAKFDIVLKDFPASTKINLAHIHNAPAGQNGGVKVNTGLTPDTGITLTTGGTTIAKAGIAVEAALMQDILDYPANYYVNVHSAVNPGGVVRGQLVKKS